MILAEMRMAEAKNEREQGDLTPEKQMHLQKRELQLLLCCQKKMP